MEEDNINDDPIDVADDSNTDDIENNVKLNSIWDDDMVTKSITEDGMKQWKCCWCNNVYASWNGTKALCHVQKVNKDIWACTARIDEAHKQAYDTLHHAQQKR